MIKVKEVLPAEGKICGELLVLTEGISFLGDVNVEEGIIKGRYRVNKKILVIPHAVGSTVGSYVIYGLSKKGKAPKAIISGKEDPVTVIGCVISRIPLYVAGKSGVEELRKFNGSNVCIEGGEIKFE